ncbi:hypothetical protein AA313_de0205046 [Arthrobotrys entomopaga]|nr:hypothetical protein AA313_de0205046 [Arthrobotrys entomopaga]
MSNNLLAGSLSDLWAWEWEEEEEDDDDEEEEGEEEEQFSFSYPKSSYAPFKKLPIDLLSPIFANLRLEELIAVALTCKSFYKVALSLILEKFESHVWPEFLTGPIWTPNRQTRVQGGPWSPPAFERNWSPWSPTPIRRESTISYREKRLWDTVCETISGKQIKHVRFLVGGEESIDVTRARLFTQRLFANLSAEKVNSIDVTAICLPDVSSFHQLTKLTIRLFSIRRENIELPALPSLQSLAVYWNATKIHPLPWNCAFVFATFCGLVLNAPTIRHVEFKSIYESVGSNLASRVRDADTDRILRWIYPKIDLVKSFDVVQLSNLKTFILEQEESFLVERFPLEATGDFDTSVSIFSVLAKFLLRHRHQLTDIQWNAADSIVDPLAQDPIQIPTFPNALSLGLRHSDYLLGGIVNTRLQDYLRKMTDSAKDLKNLRLIDFIWGQEVSAWIQTHELANFKNLTSLTIEIGLEESKILPFPNALNQMLGFTRRKDIKVILPSGLKEIDLRILRCKDSSCQDFIALKEDYLEIFTLYRHLKSLKTRLFRAHNGCWDGIVMRRLPLEPNILGDDLKKICIWVMEAKHLNDTLSSGHIAFKAYFEVAMDTQAGINIKFEGEDGYHWKMDEECILAIRKCSAIKRWAHTKGCCRRILNTDRGLPRLRSYMSYSGIKYRSIAVVSRTVDWDSGRWMTSEAQKMQAFHYLPTWMQNAILKHHNIPGKAQLRTQGMPDFSVWWEVASIINVRDPATPAVLFPGEAWSEKASLPRSEAETSQANISNIPSFLNASTVSNFSTVSNISTVSNVSTIPSCEFSFEAQFEKKLHF